MKNIKEQSLNLLNHYFRERCNSSISKNPECGKIRDGYYVIRLNESLTNFSKLSSIFEALNRKYPLPEDPQISYEYSPAECVEFYELLEDVDKNAGEWKIEKASIWGDAWRLTVVKDFLQFAVFVEKEAIIRLRILLDYLKH